MIDMKKAVAAICLLTLAGCTKNLDNDKLNAFVKDTITSQIGANVKSVTCPRDRVQKQGDTFDCTAEIDHGSAIVTITQTDANGGVSLDMKKQLILKVGEIEKQIAMAVKNSSGLDATVDCGPRFRPSIANDTFECMGKSADQQAKFKVTVKDTQGNVAFETISSPPAAGAPPAVAAEESEE